MDWHLKLARVTLGLRSDLETGLGPGLDWVRFNLDSVQCEARDKSNSVLRLNKEVVTLTKENLELQWPQRRTSNLDKLTHL